MGANRPTHWKDNIHEGKIRAPAGAMALIEAVGK
jgi:hypothetical protein